MTTPSSATPIIVPGSRKIESPHGPIATPAARYPTMTREAEPAGERGGHHRRAEENENRKKRADIGAEVFHCFFPHSAAAASERLSRPCTI